LETKDIKSESRTDRSASGTPSITSDCILGADAAVLESRSCEKVVTDEVAKVFEDINNFITVPSEQIGSVSLDDIVKGYFDSDEGLGEIFFKAVNGKFGPLSLATGNVYLNVYKKTTDKCDPASPSGQTEGYELTLNTCTLIVQGPPVTIYFKISIVGGTKYKFVESNNAECTALDPTIDEDLFPFGICNERSSKPPPQPADDPTRAPTAASTKKFGDIINNGKNYSVFLSLLQPPTYGNDFFNCTKNNELAERSTPAACRVVIEEESEEELDKDEPEEE